MHLPNFKSIAIQENDLGNGGNCKPYTVSTLVAAQ